MWTINRLLTAIYKMDGGQNTMHFSFASGEKTSLVATVHLDLYKFFNRLTAYRAFIWLNPQSFCTLAAHTLESTYNKCNLRINIVLIYEMNTMRRYTLCKTRVKMCKDFYGTVSIFPLAMKKRCIIHQLLKRYIFRAECWPITLCLWF